MPTKFGIDAYESKVAMPDPEGRSKGLPPRVPFQKSENRGRLGPLNWYFKKA